MFKFSMLDSLMLRLKIENGQNLRQILRAGRWTGAERRSAVSASAGGKVPSHQNDPQGLTLRYNVQYVDWHELSAFILVLITPTWSVDLLRPVKGSGGGPYHCHTIKSASEKNAVFLLSSLVAFKICCSDLNGWLFNHSVFTSWLFSLWIISLANSSSLTGHFHKKLQLKWI